MAALSLVLSGPPPRLFMYGLEPETFGIVRSFRFSEGFPMLKHHNFSIFRSTMLPVLRCRCLQGQSLLGKDLI